MRPGSPASSKSMKPASKKKQVSNKPAFDPRNLFGPDVAKKSEKKKKDKIDKERISRSLKIIQAGENWTPEQSEVALMAMRDPDFNAEEALKVTTPKFDEIGVKGGKKIKKLGHGILNTLSVPQAVALTGIQKALHAAGKADDTSWKNTAGYWRKGYKGGSGFLEGVGVDSKAAKKWGGLGIDIVADPLNLVGVGIVNKASKAKKAADPFKAVKQSNDARKIPTQVEKLARAKAITGMGATPGRVETVRAALKTKEMEIAKSVKGKKKRSQLRAEEKALQRELRRESLTKAFAQPKSSTETVFKANKTKKRTPKKMSGEQKLAFSRTPVRVSNDIIDEAGLLSNAGRNFAERGQHARQVASPDVRELTLRLGVGKASKNVKLKELKTTPIKDASLRRGVFKLRAVDKFANDILRASNEVSGGVDKALGRFATKLDLNSADRYLIQVVGRAQSIDANEGAKLIDELRDSGAWQAKHDEALDYILSKNQQFAKESPYINEADLYATRQAKLEADLKEAWAKGDEDAAATLLLQNVDILNRGDYIPQTITSDSIKSLKKEFRNQMRAGKRAPKIDFTPGVQASLHPQDSRAYEGFQGVTQDDFARQMSEGGMSGDLTESLSDRIADIFGGFAETAPRLADNSKVPLTYEWDSFLVMGERAKAHYRELANAELAKLINEADLPEDVFKHFNIRKAPGAIGSIPVGRNLQVATAFLKGFFTTINPVHYINNAVGDYINRLILGNTGDLKSTANLPFSVWQKLVKGKPDALAREFVIGGRKYTGEELLALSRMSGLGRGFTGAEIDDVFHLFTEGRNPMAVMNRWNMNREEAQRLETWVHNMHKGDDPFTAATNTLKVHFDYNELTDFERVWLRNGLLFYTWLKRNSMLQANGLALRPGLYAAYSDVNENRYPIPYEPDYFSEQGAIPVPGLGKNLVIPNPMNAVFLSDPRELQRAVGSSINPAARIPIEQQLNREFFTGAEVQTFDGQEKDFFGKPIPARLEHILRNLRGPSGGLVQATTKTDNPESLDEVILRALGIKFQRSNQTSIEKYKKSRELEEKKRVQDAGRKRKQEEKQNGK